MTARVLKYLLVPLAVLAVACNDSDFVAPTFLSVDAIRVAPPAESAFTTDEGFYTSNIVAAHVVAAFPGEPAETELGCFCLPFTIPLLFNGTPDYIVVYPAVAHSGVMSTLPYYTFYDTLHAPRVEMRAGDTLKLGTLTTSYDGSTDYPLLYEPFEPTQGTIQVDSVEWVTNDQAGACTGEGYGRVHVDPSQSYVPFRVNLGGNFGGRDFYVGDAQKLLYLELDVRNDLLVQVNMTSSRYENSNTTTEQVMVINPHSEWTHMYINLERTWQAFNHNKTFSISFSALNPDGEGGDVLIDNLKLLTTSKTH